MADCLPPSNNKRILITGLSGYIASNLAHHFLTLGYSIHGTVRSSIKKDIILSSLSFAPFTSRIHILIIPDITAKSAFDSALGGVNAIFHLATPINFWSGTKEEIIDPALNGTLNLLHAARKYGGPQLESFIYMSSLVTLISPSDALNTHYTSESWNSSAVSCLSNLPSSTEELPFNILYPTSKVLAERAVFDFRSTHKPNFGIASLIPGVVIGPPVLMPEKVEDINGTIKPIWEVLSGENKGLPRTVGTGMFVDVRDLAGVCEGVVGVGRGNGVVDGLEGLGVDGKRVIVVAGKGDPMVIARVLGERYPGRLGYLKGLVRDVKVEEKGGMTFDTGTAEAVVGRGWLGYERSVVDTAEALERYLDNN